jgi:hypothetical protein
MEWCNCDVENKSCPCPTHERPCKNCKGTGDADHGHYAPGICSRCGGSGIEPPAKTADNSATGFCPECGVRIPIKFDVPSGRWLCGPCAGRAPGSIQELENAMCRANEAAEAAERAYRAACDAAERGRLARHRAEVAP